MTASSGVVYVYVCPSFRRTRRRLFSNECLNSLSLSVTYTQNLSLFSHHYFIARCLVFSRRWSLARWHVNTQVWVDFCAPFALYHLTSSRERWRGRKTWNNYCFDTYCVFCRRVSRCCACACGARSASAVMNSKTTPPDMATYFRSQWRRWRRRRRRPIPRFSSL